MRIWKIVLPLAALCTLVVHAAPVDSSAVRAAARAWAAQGAALGSRLGTGVASVTAHSVTNGYSFYAVKLTGGGTAFFSSDTEFEPVIAFTSASNVDLSDEASPLLLLLRRDIAARAALRDLGRRSLGANQSGQSAAHESERKWASFGVETRTVQPTAQGATSQTVAVLTGATTSSSALPVQIVDDVCVAPLLSTKWNQTSDANGQPCFNYYMWSELGGGASSTDDWPCGCTATAMSQVLRYFRYPTAEQKEKAYTCQVDGIAVELKTKAGAFNWDKMVDWPDGTFGLTDTQCEAIGHLTWNVAVSLGSGFTSSLGSANPTRLANTFRTAFGYANAWTYWDESRWSSGKGGLHDRATREKIVHANLDAGRPVLFAIYGYPKSHLYNNNYWAGHAVVGDGYGYQSVDGEKTAYVHINMGWGGTDDVWYNIPEIDAANSGAHVGDGGYDFLYMGGAAFNIAPTEEDGTGEILSGRILDEMNVPLADAVVSVYDSDGTLVKTTTASARGIYSFVLPGDQTYTVSARSADGRKSAEPLTGIELKTTIGNASGIVDSESDVGNSCGNDIVLMEPTVRIGTRTFGSLSAALFDVKVSGETNVVLEIIAPTALHESVDIDFACTIQSSAANPITTLITRDAGACLNVLAGGSIVFKNVAFASDATGEVVVSVATGGTISVEGTIGIGRIVAADASGFVLAGAITSVESGLILGAANETTVRGAAFGRYSCSYEVATENAAKLVKFGSDEFGGLAMENGFLVWERVSVDPSAALAVATNDEFGTTYYRSLNQLFADYKNGGEVVILKDCATNAWTTSLTIRKPLTIRSADSVRTIVPSPKAGFTILSGGSLTISNLTISGYVGSRFLNISGGSLTLDAGATISDFVGTGLSDEDGDDVCGAICLTRGTVTMRPGSAIQNCRVQAEGGGLGGGLAALNGTLNLLGGSITGCSAVESGGGIWNYAATVNLAGDIRIQDNVRATGATDNLYMARSTAVQVTAPLVGAKVGLRAASSAANAIGKSFAVLNSSLSTAESKASAAAFSCDSMPDFFAVPSGSSLVWNERVDDGTCDEADAVVRVTYPNGTKLFYDSVSTAFAALTGDATVAILQNTVFTNDLTVAHRVQLASDGDVVRTLARGVGGEDGIVRIVINAGAALSVANLTLSGDDYINVSGHALLEVRGSLTMQSGALVTRVRSMGEDETTAVGAITVLSGGVLTMQSGSGISECTSISDDELSGCSAGIYLVGGTAYLRGGSVSDCRATGRAGILAVNKSKVYLSGDFSVQGNALQYYPDVRSNLSVSKNSELWVDGALTGRVGYTEDVSCSTTVFARVSNWKSWTMTSLTNSAALFRHDLTGDRGVVVTNASSTALFVWKSALASNGSYADETSADGTTYWSAGVPNFADDPVVVPCQPFSIVGMECVSEGVWRLTLNPGVEACTYSLYGAEELDAGQDAANLKAKKTLKAADIDATGNFTFDVIAPGARQFWRVFGEDGEKETP